MVIDRLLLALASRVVIMDGAMGTMVQRLRVSEADIRGVRFAAHSRDLAGNHDALVLTRPALIGGIHRDYLQAGADIIKTNTFGSTAIVQADYGLEACAYELNLAAARLARAAADEWSAATPERPRFVAGAMGPTNRPLSLAGAAAHAAGRAVGFDQVRDAYGEQVRGLLDGGVDLLLLETIVDALNATAAILAITAECDRRGVQVPLMLSVTPPAGSDRLLSGETLEAFYASVRDARPFSVGVNCGMGAAGMQTHLATLARVPGAFVACCPNAGLPNAFGDYDDTPAITARWLHEFAATGMVNIVGGCCGTTPEYIPAIAAAVEGLQPRRIPAVEA